MNTLLKILWTVLTSICLCTPAYGAIEMNFRLSSCKEDYTLTSRDGLIFVDTRNIPDVFLTDGPYLPMRQVHIAIPSDMAVSRISIVPGSATILSQNIPLAKAPAPVPTNTVITEENILTTFDGQVNPTAIIEHKASRYKECTILHYTIYPFEYDNSNNLSIYSDIDICISLENGDDSAYNLTSICGLPADIWKPQVINPDYLESVSMPIQSFILNEDYLLVNGDQSSPLDYVIITNNQLQSSFADLLEWKITKGLRSRIITTESIAQDYEGKTLQEKIKRCIYSLYQENGLSYVLLGGDDSIVPSVKCHATCVDSVEMIPSDLYFGCFAGQFDWDKNKNGIIGEIDDECDFVPSVIVSRLPVSTATNVKTITNKILTYEKDPFQNMNLLLTGNEMRYFDWHTHQADSHQWSEVTYNSYIRPYWWGAVDYFFDSEVERIVSPTALVSKFNSGYDFISMNCHGKHSEWLCRTGDTFGISHVNQITRNGVAGTIVTTTACDTNAFDWYSDPTSNYYLQPSLSQAFINSSTSGVVGYFGCSRLSWFQPGDSEGKYSVEFDRMFYKTLFENPDTNKSFGRITTIAKTAYLGVDDKFLVYRWLQLGLNAIGDPEMPIYATFSKDLSSVFVKQVYIGTKSAYTIDTGEDNCNICITGTLNGHKVQAIYRNVRKIQLPYLPTNPVICVTKQNFRPFVGTGTSYFQPTALNADHDEESQKCQIVSCVLASSDILKLTTENLSDNMDTHILICDIMGSDSRLYPMYNSNTLEVDMGNLDNGVYVVTLMADGVPVDYRRVIKR